jgi:NADPH:quinone reductase-like Zn-dependent oxidoreductase
VTPPSHEEPPAQENATRLFELLGEVKQLAREYYELTGRPLGVTGEIAEYEAARLLNIKLASVRQQGYDAILVNGASGGVGTMAVQIAKTLGAEVTGVCGTGSMGLVRSLGADHLIDYAREDFTQSRQRFDVILDNVLNHPPKAVARVLAPGGTFSPNSLGYTGGLFAGLPRMARAALMGLGSTNVKTVAPAMNRENLAALLQFLESGQVKVVIAHTYPLRQAAAAVAHMLEHHPGGKIAITV